MAASMVRAYIQYNMPRQFLMDAVWKEQSMNCILHTFCLSQMQYQSYHTTSLLLKKRKTKDHADITMVLKKQFLENPHAPLEVSMNKNLPVIKVWHNIKVKELAELMNRDVNQLFEFLQITIKNIQVNEDSALPISLVSKILKGFNMKPMTINKKNEIEEPNYEDIIKRPPSDESNLVRRPPVVTIMGHIDHGKTTLLDALRNTSVVKSEFGGITQHIGAFNVRLKSGEQVTFLDTPGHAAFASMRYRGAHVTDIVVLVVAADDGVMKQTVQSIEMAKKANVSIIVALNKIDKPNADIKRAQNELAKHNVVVEEQGGKVQCIKISALKKINLEELTEAIVLEAQIMNLRGDPTGLVEAVIIECTHDLKRGTLVTVLVQRGTLRKGCFLVSGLAWAKVRAMFDDTGHLVLQAKPSEAVQIIGWRSLPNVGDEILEVENEKMVQTVLKHREQKHNETLAEEHKVIATKKEEEHREDYTKQLRLKQIFGRERGIRNQILKAEMEKKRKRMMEMQMGDVPELNIVVKADVAGSVEAILDTFDTYTHDDKCRLNVVHYGIGSIVETDVQLAEPFNAIIYGFNVNISKQLEDKAKDIDVPIRFYNVVYKLFDNVIEEINSKLPEVDVEEVLGEATVLQNFKLHEKKKTYVAGCRCVKGVLLKSELFNIIRDNEIIYKGKLESMRHLKEEVSTIKTDVECGLRFEDSSIPLQPGDTIVCYRMQKQRQTINWNLGF